MSKSCKLVYLDSDGNKSKAYYDNLKYGQDKAIKAYLDQMNLELNTKFQKVFNFDNIENQLKSIVVDDFKYQAEREKGEMVSGTTLTKSLSNDFDGKKVSQELAIKAIAKQRIMADWQTKYRPTDENPNPRYIIRNAQAAEDLKFENSKELVKEYVDAITEEFNTKGLQDSDEAIFFENYSKQLEDFWGTLTEKGTDVHKIMEDYVAYRNEYYTDETSQTTSSIISKFLNDLYEGKITDPDLRQAASRMKQVEASNLLKQLEKDVLGRFKGKRIKLMPELSMVSQELGMSGQIDLLVIDEDGNAYIYDYKTKSPGKLKYFSTGNKMMKGEAAILEDSKLNHAALQTTGYRAILGSVGINVMEANVIYIEAEMGTAEDQKDEVKNPTILDVIPLSNHRDVVGRHMKKTKGVDIYPVHKSIHEEGRLNDLNDIFTELTNKDRKELDDADAVYQETDIENKANDLELLSYFNQVLQEDVEFLEPKNVESRRKQLKAYYEELNKQDLVARNVESLIGWFNGGKDNTKFRGNLAYNAEAILSGYDKNNYTIERINSKYGFESAPSSMILLRHKQTGAGTILNLTNRDNSDVKLLGVKSNKESQRYNELKAKLKNNDITQEEVQELSALELQLSQSSKNERNHIFAKYRKAAHIESIYNTTPFLSTNHNYRLLEAGIIAKELANSGVINSVDKITVAKFTKSSKLDVNKDFHEKILSDIEPQLNILGVLTGEKLNSYYRPILNKSNKIKATNHLEALIQDIENWTFLKSNDQAARFKESIVHARSLKDLNVLAEHLYELAERANNYYTDTKNPNEYQQAIARTILEIENLQANTESLIKGIGMDKDFRLDINSSNPYIKRMAQLRRDAELHMRDDLHDFNIELKEKVDKLEELYQSKGIAGYSGKIDKYLIFRNLFKVDPNEDLKQGQFKAEDLYVLKDPSDSSLKKEEKDFIEFFNKTIESFYAYTLTKQEQEDLKKNLVKGFVPIMPASKENRLAREQSTGKRFKEEVLKGFSGSSKAMADENSRDSIRYNIKLSTKFNEAVQGSKSSYYKNKKYKTLGTNVRGEVINTNPYPQETNLEYILKSFATAQVRTKAYTRVVSFYNSAMLLSRIDKENKAGVQNFQGYASNLMELLVLNQVQAEEHPGLAKVLDTAGNVMTTTSMGLSPVQVLRETFTNAFQAHSNLMAQMMMRKEDRRYDIKSFTKAVKLVTASRFSMNKEEKLAYQLNKLWGVHGEDIESGLTADKLISRMEYIGKRSRLFTAANVPLEVLKQATVIAHLIYSGDWDAYSLNDKGRPVYDETKDKRFKGIFNIDGSLKSKEQIADKYIDLNRQGDLAMSDGDNKIDALKGLSKEKRDLLKKRALYVALKQDLQEEGNLNEDGTLKKSRLNREIEGMKQYATTVYGTMDKDGKATVSGKMLWRQAIKFKMWLIPKYNHMITKAHMSDDMGQYLYDETTDTAYWQAARQEGTIQTILFLANEIKSILTLIPDVKGGYKKLDRLQRENLMRLFSALINAVLMYTLINAAYNLEWSKSPQGKTVLKAALDGAADLNTFATFSGVLNQSPIALVGKINQLVGATVQMAEAGFGGAEKLAPVAGAKIKSLLPTFKITDLVDTSVE